MSNVDLKKIEEDYLNGVISTKEMVIIYKELSHKFVSLEKFIEDNKEAQAINIDDLIEYIN